jgi:hypothetical protein
MRRLILAPVLIAAATILSGCLSSQGLAGKTIHLDTAGPLVIDVESFAGNVRVAANPMAAGTTIRVHRRADYGVGRRGEGLEAMEGIEWSARIQPGDLGQVLRVQAWCEQNPLNLLYADIEIVAQNIENLYIKTQRGSVEAVDVTGNISVITSDGIVRIASNHPLLGAVSVQNRRGDVFYRVRGESTGHFECTTSGGETAVDAEHGRLELLPGTARGRLFAVLNSGKNPIRLRTTDGDVRVSITKTPTIGLPWTGGDWLQW